MVRRKASKCSRLYLIKVVLRCVSAYAIHSCYIHFCVVLLMKVSLMYLLRLLERSVVMETLRSFRSFLNILQVILFEIDSAFFFTQLFMNCFVSS